ncbi:DMT family transporter [Synergistaceae bacterium OttesenSCG-928-D05]|nr:DMT family transporter [Synergistaceae bacterium OttesenSCG-928-D05]
MTDPKQTPDLKYYFFVVAAGVCWGFTGTLQALAPAGASSLTIGSIRLVMAGSLLLLFSLFKDRSSIFKERWNIRGLLIAAAGQVAYQLSFFSAVRLTGVALGTMIAIGMAPVMAGFLGLFFFRERLTIKWAFSTAVAITGCALLIFGTAHGVSRVSAVGCGLAFFAAFGYTLTGVGMRMIGKRDPIQSVALINTLSGIAVLPILIYLDTSWMFTVRGAMVVLILSIVSTMIPMMLFNKSVQHIALGSAYTLSLTEPLTASMLAVFLLGERLTFVSASGAALIFLSIYFLMRGAK